MTALSLVLSCMTAFFHPTIDGARQTLPYIETTLPYVLGISVPPPNLTFVTVIQGETMYYDDYCQGTFTIGTITNTLPVYIYEDNLLQYTIVPEPVSIAFIAFGTLLIRRKR